MTAMARDIRREHRHPRGQSEPSLSVPVPGIGVCQGEGADPPWALSLPHQQGHPMLQRDRAQGPQPGPSPPSPPHIHTGLQRCHSWRGLGHSLPSWHSGSRASFTNRDTSSPAPNIVVWLFSQKNTTSRFSPPIKAFSRSSHGETADLKCRSSSCTGKPPGSHTN